MDDNKVKDYFDDIAVEFDNIYDEKGSVITKLADKIFRKSLYQRVPYTVKECRPLENKTVLDIGCGSGRISFLLANEGAYVTGIDYAEKMIVLAKKYLEKIGNANINFFQSDFMKDFSEDKKFDVTIAIGVFDYIQDPIPFLTKTRKITKNKIISSFPAKYNFQSSLRKAWLKTRNCPVYFYTEDKIKQIFSNAGMENIKIAKFPKDAVFAVDYIVTANLST